MPMYADLGNGVAIAGGDGIIIHPRSEIWDLEPERLVSVLALARQHYALLMEAETITCLGPRPSRYTDRGNFSDEDIALFRRSGNNPYVPERSKKEMAAYLAALDERESSVGTLRLAKKTLRANILARDAGLCRYCGKDAGKPAHVDHVIPYSLGGLTELDNLVTACADCNHRKAGRTLNEAGMTLLPVP